MSRGKIVLAAILIALFLGTGFYKDSFSSLKAFGLLIAAWSTFAIFSFLYKDNPLYRFAEHVMVGLAMGYFTVYYVFNILEDQWFNPVILGELRESDQLFGSQAAWRFGLIVPAIGGILMLTRVVPKIAWMSRWSMALLIGLGSGIAIPWTIQGNITTQLLVGTQAPMQYMQAMHHASGSTALWWIYDEIPNAAAAGLPGWVETPFWQIGAPLLIIGTICGLIYFFFSVPHRGLIGRAAGFGIWILMIGFGASFGLTVMARLSLFIGRIIFLFKNWLELPWLM